MNEIKNLLNNVQIIANKYDEIAKITGENFNIFSVMSVERREVKTHSAIIGELLNRNGSHGCGSIFLELFINNINEKIQFDLNTSYSIVEEHIGKINEDKTEGGRIDIVIKDGYNNVIVIENKIDAYEQENQLIRYNNAYPNAKIFFLTLDGHQSNTNGENEYSIISYKTEILNWLELCLKETVKFPMLREIINQYIYLIKKITNQTTNNKMSEEIRKLITEDNIESIINLNQEVTFIVLNVRNKIFNKLKEFFTPFKIEVAKIHIEVAEDSDGFYIGYQYYLNGENKSSDVVPKQYYSKFESIANKKIHSTDWNFIWYSPLHFVKGDKFEHLDKTEIVKMYRDENYLNKFVQQIINEESEIRKQFLSQIEPSK